MDLKIGQTKIVHASAGALSFNDWKNKFPQERNELGYAAIIAPKYIYKDGKYIQEKNLNVAYPYVLDWKNDGWFRKYEGNAKGYGIKIRDIKLTTQKTQPWAGDGETTGGRLFSVKITFEPIGQFEDTEVRPNETLLAKLYVHHSVELPTVINYIKQHMDTWVD